ncbi:zinc finger protein GLIS3 isoform X4 [Numida meleagris]|uniref:zinc finger protein GLIS3 isoform X4 n=1 Tax=Numida meleagris TaxID=8996 RepID=UPI000B3E0FC4|nr:zinc finger protein GLIS3 isoform X4 [Numida meleagris]
MAGPGFALPAGRREVSAARRARPLRSAPRPVPSRPACLQAPGKGGGGSASPPPGEGGLGYGAQCKSIGKSSCNNLVITSSPMTVQQPGPVSPPANRVSTACNQISSHLQSSMDAPSLSIPASDTRSLLSHKSLDSTTSSLSESQFALTIKQEWSHGYGILHSLPLGRGLQNGSVLGNLLNFPPATSVSSNCISNPLPSNIFGMENSHSPNPSACHSSSQSQSAHSKKKALSLSPLSDGIGIDFSTIIRTSPTSLVAYINSSRTSPANASPQPEVYGHFLGVRGSCIPQNCSVPAYQKGLLMANCNIAFPEFVENGAGEYQRMQQLEQVSLQTDMMTNMVIQQGMFPMDSQAVGALKNEQLDDFSGHTIDRPPPPPLLPPTLEGPPPPYHAHQHQLPHSLPGHMYPLPLPPSAPDPQLEEDGDLDDFNGKHGCRWIDCNMLYDQQEELVRHIEKIHIDQRKGEDFTCFWAGCPRRLKPFNARYKLLIHMRVHSGEKPNKCTLRSSSELGQDILNDCLTIQPLQTASSPHNAMDDALGHSPGPACDIYSVAVFPSTQTSRSGTAAGALSLSQLSSHPSPGCNIQSSSLHPPSQLSLLSVADSERDFLQTPPDLHQCPKQGISNWLEHFKRQRSQITSNRLVALTSQHISPQRISVPPPMMQRQTSQPPHLQQPSGIHLKTYQSASNPFQPNSLHIQGFYGQLQTFCPPHCPDTQKNVQHNVSCSMVPPFEDCLFPASVSQAGLGVFHRTFSAHSGITVYDFPAGPTGVFGDSTHSMPEDSSFLQINAMDHCPTQLSSVYMEG